MDDIKWEEPEKTCKKSYEVRVGIDLMRGDFCASLQVCSYFVSIQISQSLIIHVTAWILA